MRSWPPTAPSGLPTRCDVTERVWTIKEALDWTREYLASKGDDRPRLSAEWLLAGATGLTRIEAYAYFDRPLTDDERSTLRESVRRRATGEPLQYILGEAAFRHLTLKVDPSVLIPRPETEILVDQALEAIDRAIALRGEARVLDLCTGSGCIALSIAHERAPVRVWATDISRAALDVAYGNAALVGVEDRVELIECDLAAGVDVDLLGTFDVVISNPPYIPTADLESLPDEVSRFEPRVALDGGVDGLEVFDRIAQASRRLLRPGGLLACELDENRVCAAADKCVEWYQEVRVVRDLAGRDRIVTAILPT